jgi:tetratricopeptide (TPR) repeat protein
VLVLDRHGKREQAEKTLSDALSGARAFAATVGNPATRPADPVGERAVLRLAALCRELKLSDPDAFFAVAEKLYGVTPDYALARAADLTRQGKPGEATQFVDDARKRKPVGGDVAWRVAWARYLDSIKDGRAAAEWVAIGDDPAVKGNVLVQRMALASPSVQHDSAFLKRCADRVQALTGDQGVTWRLAQVKILLQEPPGRINYGEASRLLREVITLTPDDIEARLMLALVLERTGNPRGSIEHALYAVQHKPTPSSRLTLASLYESQSEHEKAREQLAALDVAQLNPAQRLAAARVYGFQGDTASALKLMEPIPVAELDAAGGAFLADVYRRGNRPEKAEALYKQLFDRTDLTGPVQSLVLGAADFYAAAGRAEDAAKTLARLDGLTLAPGVADAARGDFFARHGDAAKALEHYRAAVKAAPADESLWRALVLHHLRAGQTNEALAAADDAAKAAPGGKALVAFRQNADLVRRADKYPRLAPLSFTLVTSPADATVIAEALQAYVESFDARKPATETVARLRPIADKAAKLPVLRAMLVEDYNAAGQRDEAVNFALRGVEDLPNSPDLARLAAQTLLAAGDVTRAMEQAKHWRDLTAADPMDADVLIARIHLAKKDYASVLKQLDPYAASADPDRDVISLRTLAMIRLDQPDQAAAALWPLVSKGPQWRQMWMDRSLNLAGAPATAAAWLDRLAPGIAKDAIPEQALLATAWFQLSVMAKDKAYRDKSRQILEELIPRSGKNHDAYYVRAIVDEYEGDTKSAEAMYRKALELQPNLPVAQNNLAMLIAKRNGDLAEARDLATKAVQAAPDAASFHDTLGQIQMQAKDYKGAMASFRTAGRLDSRNPEWKVRLGQACVAAGETNEANRLLDEIDAMVPDKSKLAEPLRKELEQLRDALTKKPAG